jgi:outer membrane usher protein
VQFGTPDPRADVVASRRLATPGIAVLPSTADALLSSARGSSSLGAEGWSTSGSTRLVGANTVSFIAQDALGRTQVITQPLLAKTVLADPGCSSFSMGIGKVREDYALQSNQYGAVFANTTVRCGLSRKLTLETHGEYLEGQTAAYGVDLASKVGTVGLASAAVASSHGEGESGWLAKIGFEHSNSLFDLALRTRLQSRGFREAAAQGATDPVVQQTLASVGLKLNDAHNLALAYAAQTTAIGERADVLALTQSMHMGAYGAFSMTAGHSVAQGQDSSVYLFYSRPFGDIVASGAALKGIMTPNFDLALRTSGLPARSVR